MLTMMKKKFIEKGKNELVFVANSDFLIPISCQPKVIRHLILQTMNSESQNNLILKYQICLHHQVAEIQGIENFSLWQDLNSCSAILLITQRKWWHRKQHCKATFEKDLKVLQVLERSRNI